MVTIERSAFIENRAAAGGGAAVFGNVQIHDSEFRGNIATSDLGNGGALSLSSGNHIVRNSDFRDNVAGRDGGGIYVNLAVAREVWLAENTVVSNSAGDLGGGIAIDASGGIAVISQSTIAQNSAAGSGGGVWVRADGQARLRIENSTIHSNDAHVDGGGLSLMTLGQGEALVQQATISLNKTNGSGGGIALHAVSTGKAEIAHSTVIENMADANENGFGPDAGGGMSAKGPGSLRLAHTILAVNRMYEFAWSDIDNSLTGNLQVSHSLIGDNAGSGLTPSPVGMPDANGNLIGGSLNIDPQLAPLAHHGGKTLTHALAPNSPALNAGDPAAIAGIDDVPLHDQRSAPFMRVYGGRIDIGAFEAQPNPLAGDYNFDTVVDTADYVLWRHTRGLTNDLRTDGNGDGVVDDADRLVWRANFGRTLQDVGQSASSIEFESDVLVPKPPALPATDVRNALRSSADGSFTAMRQRAVGSRLARSTSTGFSASDEDLLVSAVALQHTNEDERSDFRQSTNEADATARDEFDAGAIAVDRVFEAIGLL
jgi:hypothetical protein